jgi:predicted NBD/HSP70 family sugar kinase
MAREMAEQPAMIGALLERRGEFSARLRTLAPGRPAGVLLVARGSSDNAAIYGRYVLEAALRRPVSLAAPSLWTRYGLEEDLRGYLAIGVSQSGRTPEIADTLERIGAAGATTVAVTNDAGSPLAEIAAATLDLRVGTEEAVPTTKTLSAQLAAFAILAAALLAAVGEQSRGVAQGVEDFVFLSVGTGLGAGLVLRGELHRGHHGAAGEVDYALGEGHYIERSDDPAATGVSAYAAALAADGRLATRLAPPYDARAIFGAARAGDELALLVVAEEARRIARHVLPIAAVTDVELIVLGGGIGANGDLLLAPIRELLAQRCPYPPRVEVSSLGDAAVLTGALAFGLRAALDNVFTRRSRVARG